MNPKLDFDPYEMDRQQLSLMFFGNYYPAAYYYFDKKEGKYFVNGKTETNAKTKSEAISHAKQYRELNKDQAHYFIGDKKAMIFWTGGRDDESTYQSICDFQNKKFGRAHHKEHIIRIKNKGRMGGAAAFSVFTMTASIFLFFILGLQPIFLIVAGISFLSVYFFNYFDN